MLKAIADGQFQLKPVSDDSWEVMLPKEQEEHLLVYYHTLRTEFKHMTDELQQLGAAERIAEWLERPWAKILISTLALLEVAVNVIDAAHKVGVFYIEEDLSEKSW